eukprot:TRINITY_DN11827_c0_g1_i2.p1 TRINITY_DN11827_c0_g1~~TRINITY_DN11827_c0_g1_i2.p1  ORF type:complete len:689 (+),score=145.68 TRINITY_DN11827_c0_g1_i2:61-2127(+)
MSAGGSHTRRSAAPGCALFALALQLLLVFETTRAALLSKTRDYALDFAAPKFDELKNSVLRFTVYRRKFYWSRPFVDHDVSGSLGSGFLVREDPPLICTCAHVVSGADQVFVQVTRFGKTKFRARVATISNDADVALVVLEDVEGFRRRLAEANLTAKALPFASRTPPVGHAALAPGFPLGQRTLTLSTGVISGVDHVAFHHRNLAIQSTAIISQGNSGSPLLDGETLEVIGMNYAKNTGEAQINYVVPLWRLRQVIQKHQDMERREAAKELPQHFRLVDHGLVITPGTEALYLLSEGNQRCDSGPLISAIYPASPFNDAEPPVEADSFLVSMDGVQLDRYGQGTKEEFVQELVDFEDLMWMRNGTGEQAIDLVTCKASTGALQKHRMSLAWRMDRQGRGVRYIYEPRFENVSWEIFGDLIFMDLTENHIQLLGGGDGELMRYLVPTERQNPRLAVMLRKEGGDAEEALGLRVGQNLAVVESVNGHAVRSLKDLRRHFYPKNTSGRPLSGQYKGYAGGGANASAALVSPGAPQRLRGWGRNATKLGDAPAVAGDEGGDSSAETPKAVWSLRTAEGREFAAVFEETLLAQASESMTEKAPQLLSPLTMAALRRLGREGEQSGTASHALALAAGHAEAVLGSKRLEDAGRLSAAGPLESSPHARRGLVEVDHISDLVTVGYPPDAAPCAL